MVTLFLLNPLVLNDAYDASHGVKFKFPYEAAYVSAKYGHFCTGVLGFFLPPLISVITILSKKN